jgi:hypothetical protein
LRAPAGDRVDSPHSVFHRNILALDMAAFIEALEERDIDVLEVISALGLR